MVHWCILRIRNKNTKYVLFGRKNNINKKWWNKIKKGNLLTKIVFRLKIYLRLYTIQVILIILKDQYYLNIPSSSSSLASIMSVQHVE